jgi:hypothetical protein
MGFHFTAAGRLNEMGRWNADAIERQLAHQEMNDVRRAYTHAAEYWAERQEIMQIWADQLDHRRVRWNWDECDRHRRPLQRYRPDGPDGPMPSACTPREAMGSGGDGRLDAVPGASPR